jgi:hypothetical protein
MSRATPENKVKAMVRKVLAEFCDERISVEGFSMVKLKQYWPVPSGFGASDLDCILCYYGKYIAIETKAPGEKPTPRQKLTIAETRAAGGAVFVIDGEAGCHELRVFLQGLKDANDR